MQELVYEDFTQLFYANMVVEQKTKVISIFIKGRSHTLMPTFLNEILEIPNERKQITPGWGAILVKCYKPNKWVNKLTKGKTPLMLFGNLLHKIKEFCITLS